MIKIAKVTNTQVEYTLKKGLSPKKPSVDAEVFGDETHLAGGVTVAVTVPARLFQGRHQLRTAVDVLTQFLHRRLHLSGVRRINTGQLPFQICTIFYHNILIFVKDASSVGRFLEVSRVPHRRTRYAREPKNCLHHLHPLPHSERRGPAADGWLQSPRACSAPRGSRACPSTSNARIPASAWHRLSSQA